MNLTVNDLSYTYRGGHTALQNVSFTARQGELLSVLGPNGAGKSTLFRCILGGLPDYGGAILLDGQDARTLEQRALAAHIAYIPQIHRPTFGYSVLDTALMGLTRQLSPFRSPSAAQEEQAMAALERMGVAQLARRSFSELSGGEPTSSLDYGNQLRVLRCIKELARRGYTVILSTHDPQHALRFADCVLALSGGGVAAFGGARDVLTAELLHRLYGVDAVLLDTAHGPAIVPKGGVDDVPLDR